MWSVSETIRSCGKSEAIYARRHVGILHRRQVFGGLLDAQLSHDSRIRIFGASRWSRDCLGWIGKQASRVTKISTWEPRPREKPKLLHAVGMRKWSRVIGGEQRRKRFQYIVWTIACDLRQINGQIKLRQFSIKGGLQETKKQLAFHRRDRMV